GRVLAFYGEDLDGLHLWVWDRTTKSAVRVSERLVDAYTDSEVPLWSTDGKKIISKFVTTSAAKTAANEKAADPWAVAAIGGSTVKVDEAIGRATRDEHNWARYPLSDLGMIDIATGEIKVFRANAPIAGYWLSKNGRWLWYTRNPSKIADGMRSMRWTVEAV